MVNDIDLVQSQHASQEKILSIDKQVNHEVVIRGRTWVSKGRRRMKFGGSVQAFLSLISQEPHMFSPKGHRVTGSGRE